MKKKLGFWSIVLLCINSIIGSGIFISPGSVVTMAGDKTPLIYGMAAVFAIVLALTFASAAKYVSKSGAAYAYTTAAFGENVGFYVGLTRFVAAGIAWGVMATSVIKTVLSIFGMDNTSFTNITVGFILLMVILLGINLFGPRLFEIINNFSTIGKILALVTAISAGLYIIISSGVNHLSDIHLFTTASGEPLIPQMNRSIFVTATIAAFYAFTGFESVASGSEDMEEPEKNLPRAIPLAILIIAAIYIGIVATALMVNPKAMIETKEVVALVAVYNNVWIQKIILYGALISMFGINVAASFHTPRVLEAMAKKKQMPVIFSKRTSSDFPLNAFLVTFVLAIVMPMVFQYNMTSIIILSSVSRFIQFLTVPIGVIFFYYGKQEGEVLPTAKKNFVMDVFIPALAFILSVFLLVQFNWKGQFTTVDANQQAHVNIVAILTMIIGYVVLPFVFYLVNRNKKVND